MATIDTITIDAAGEIDANWTNSGMPDMGLRIVSYRISGNRYRTFLTVPDNDASPCYERINGNFQHVDGPTLAEWERAQRNVQIALDNAAGYEAQAAESAANGCAVNARCFADKAAFYRNQAAQIASR